MPLVSYITAPQHARLGVWHITESEDYFLKKIEIPEAEKSALEFYKGKRRLEWLAGRNLLQIMTGWAYSIVKDEFGKPHLSTSNYQISLSHSDHYVAAIIAPCAVGIDIQSLTNKVERIAERVFNAEKFEKLKEETRQEHLHVYWGAKEAMYKAYGRRELDFKKHILIEAFHYENTEGSSHGVVVKDDFKMNFDIFYKKIENHILVYAIEQNPIFAQNGLY